MHHAQAVNIDAFLLHIHKLALFFQTTHLICFMAIVYLFFGKTIFTQPHQAFQEKTIIKFFQKYCNLMYFGTL